MKTTLWNTFVILLALIVWAKVAEVVADYQYDNSIASYWQLSVKASTLDMKADYLDKFVKAIEDNHLSGNDALFLKTPDNSVEQNLNTLHSLQTRMHEIKSMDVRSFEYQQAINQITAQEQGEASKMLSIFEGKWYLDNHFFLWEWVDVVKFFLLLLALFVNVIALHVAHDKIQ